MKMEEIMMGKVQTANMKLTMMTLKTVLMILVFNDDCYISDVSWRKEEPVDSSRKLKERNPPRLGWVGWSDDQHQADQKFYLMSAMIRIIMMMILIIIR